MVVCSKSAFNRVCNVCPVRLSVFLSVPLDYGQLTISLLPLLYSLALRFIVNIIITIAIATEQRLSAHMPSKYIPRLTVAVVSFFHSFTRMTE